MIGFPGFRTVEEVRGQFGWSRQQVNATAKREGWAVVKVGGGVLYQAVDVERYAKQRRRTQLAKLAGWRGHGLHRDSRADCQCPTCGGYAVQVGEAWRCEAGHSG